MEVNIPLDTKNEDDFFYNLVPISPVNKDKYLSSEK